jgi:hypothetical protein
MWIVPVFRPEGDKVEVDTSHRWVSVWYPFPSNPNHTWLGRCGGPLSVWRETGTVARCMRVCNRVLYSTLEPLWQCDSVSRHGNLLSTHRSLCGEEGTVSRCRVTVTTETLRYFPRHLHTTNLWYLHTTTHECEYKQRSWEWDRNPGEYVKTCFSENIIRITNVSTPDPETQRNKNLFFSLVMVAKFPYTNFPGDQ